MSISVIRIAFKCLYRVKGERLLLQGTKTV